MNIFIKNNINYKIMNNKFTINNTIIILIIIKYN